jgi:F-type H+-transporting ATPase subunit b
MFFDPQFWVAIAFIIFVIAIFNPVRKLLSSSLDAKINLIKESIEEAENLKNETQIILSEIKKRQNEVEIEIKDINLNSKEKIKLLETQAQIKLSDQISKRDLLAKTKIEQMTRDANLIVQEHITETAINATLVILENKLNKDEKQNLINQSINDLELVFKN